MHRKITDPYKQRQIEDAMSKVIFNICYAKGQMWEQNTRAKGRDEGYIERNRNFYKPRVRMAPPKTDSFRRQHEGNNEAEVPTELPIVKPRIKWSCADETFIKDGTEYTVDAYFQEIYDVTINFPNMPIIGTKRGYFPVEFLFQDVSRAPGGNEPNQVKAVLEYHHNNAGIDRLRHLDKLARSICPKGGDRSYESLLRSFGVKLQLRPSIVEARRVPPLL